MHLMRVRAVSRAASDRLARPPATWQKIVAAPLAVLLSLGLWDKRGAAVGIAALVVYGVIFLLVAFDHSGVMAWSRRHAVLDALTMVPLTFLALAYLTELALGACLGIALAAGMLLVVVALHKRGGVPAG